MIYLVCFAVSIVLFCFAEKSRAAYKAILLVAALVPPLLLAALRDPSVGRDVSTYVLAMHDYAVASDNAAQFLNMLKTDSATRDLEVLFSLVCYVVTYCSDDIGALFFVYELINLVFVVAAICGFNKLLEAKGSTIRVSLPIAMACYYLLFYNMSLTMYRQSLACAICMFAVVVYLSERRVVGVLLVLFASLFHSTALFSLLLLLLFEIVSRHVKLAEFVLVIFGLAFATTGDKAYFALLGLANNFIPIPGRYLAVKYMSSAADINYAWLFLIAVIFVESWLLWRIDKMSILRRCFFAMSLVMVFLFPLSVVSANAGRVYYYLFYFAPIALPLWNEIVPLLIRRPEYPVLGLQLATMLSLVFWLGTVGLNDYTDTINYVFAMAS